jgi:hypothetical protein
VEDNNINGRSERSSIHYVRLGHLIFTQRCILDSMSLFAGLTLGRRSMVDHKIRSYASYLVFSAELEGLYIGTLVQCPVGHIAGTRSSHLIVNQELWLSESCPNLL